MIGLVDVARCPDHGLHDLRRTSCFTCGRPAEAIAMVPASEYDALCEVIRVLGVVNGEIDDVEQDLGHDAAHVLARILAGDGAREILTRDQEG